MSVFDLAYLPAKAMARAKSHDGEVVVTIAFADGDSGGVFSGTQIGFCALLLRELWRRRIW